MTEREQGLGCPKAGKKSLSHPKYVGGLTHLLQGEVWSKQLSVPLGHRKPCPKRLYGWEGWAWLHAQLGVPLALPRGSDPPLAASPCRNVQTYTLMHPDCSPTPLQPLCIPCPSALMSPSQVPAELRPIEGLCPAALGHFCPLHASPWCRAVHPSLPTLHHAGRAWGGGSPWRAVHLPSHAG